MYKALKSFSGAETMRRGEVKAITDKKVIADLLRAGYIEEVKKPAPSQKKTANKEG